VRVAAAPANRWEGSGGGVRPGAVALGALTATTALVVGLFTFAGLGLVLAGVCLAAALAIVVWRYPLAGMLALVVLGTAHELLMLLLYHFTGSGLVVKLAQIWKEAIVAVLLLRVVELAFRRRAAPRLHLLDLLIVLFLAYATLYVAYPSSVEDSSLFSKVMGLRADTAFLLAYFVGRGVTVRVRDVRALLLAFYAAAAVTSVAAAAQFVAPDAANALFNAVGFQEYLTFQRGDFSVVNAVRSNEIAGTVIPRASSLFLSDLGLAFYCMLAVPLSAALFFTARGVKARLVGDGLTLAMVATTALTVTRSAMLALGPLLALVTIRAVAPVPAALLLLQLALGAALVGLRVGLTPSLLQSMFSLDEGSAQGHLAALDESVRLLREQPLGRGLGTAGQIAQRLISSGGVTNESWYLQIATEMGIAAALLFLAITTLLVVVSLVQFGRVRDRWLRSLCLGMAGAAVGYGLVSATLHAWENLTISIVFWLFAGLTVRARAIEGAGTGEVDADRRLA